MSRKSLFERMENELNFSKEYLKFERIICLESFSKGTLLGTFTINDVIEYRFRSWKHRSNYTTFEELRTELGFNADLHELKNNIVRKIDVNDFLLYCEMILNMIFGCQWPDETENARATILETMAIDLAKINHEIQFKDDGKVLVVEINAAASSVADIIEPKVSDKVIEYNHFLLKGDLERKQEILFALAAKIEPQRKLLSSINKQLADDLFFLLNNMNIRHNNKKEGDKNYNRLTSQLSNSQLEDWYDDSYQLLLLAFLLIDNIERSSRINKIKKEAVE